MSTCPPGPRPTHVLLLGAACLALASGAFADPTDGHWVELGPPSFEEHSAILDPIADRLITFGGRTTALSSATWALSLSGTTSWSRLNPSGELPAARWGHTAIYDPTRHRMIVFGGLGGDHLNDVWELSLGGPPTWTRLVPSGPLPQPRFEHVAVYDPSRDRMLIHGGVGAQAFDDVWAFDLATHAWSQVSTSNSSPARSEHAAAYDPIRDRLLVFGGGTVGLANDVWALDLTALDWTQISTQGVPVTPRRDAQAVYDAARDRLHIVGGWDQGPWPLADSWALELSDDATWIQMRSQGHWGHATAYDPSRDGVIVNGGRRDNASMQPHTWLAPCNPNASWVLLHYGGPSLRESAEGLFDPVRNRLIMHGGSTFGGIDQSPRGDLWAIGLDPGQWTKLTEIERPGNRLYHSLIYDRVADRIVMFGGDKVYGQYPQIFNEVWTFDLSGPGGWELATPSGPTPERRAFHVAAYDSDEHRMIVFGGAYGESFNDAWSLSLHGNMTWSRIEARGIPPVPTFNTVGVFDTENRQLVLLSEDYRFWNPGGGYVFDDWSDVWVLDLSGEPTWVEVETRGTAPTASFGTTDRRAVFDPVRRRMIVLSRNEQHALSLDGNWKWEPLVTAGVPPSVNYRPPVVYDSLEDRLLVFAGNNTNGIMALEFEDPVTASVPSHRAAGLALLSVRPNPASTRLSIEFSPSGHGPVRLELLDLAGRSVHAIQTTAAGGRTQNVEFRGLGRLAPGAYFVRLEQNGRSTSRMVMLLH